MVDLFATQDPSEVSAHVEWAGRLRFPSGSTRCANSRNSWIHRQQLLIAVGHNTDLRGDLLGPILDGMKWAYAYRLEAVPADPGDTLTISIKGSVSARWHLLAGRDGWRFTSDPGNVVASIELTTDDAWRLLTNNLPLEARRSIRHTGATRLVDTALNTRAIIGDPQ